MYIDVDDFNEPYITLYSSYIALSECNFFLCSVLFGEKHIYWEIECVDCASTKHYTNTIAWKKHIFTQYIL